jgi:hypothetical protein
VYLACAGKLMHSVSIGMSLRLFGVNERDSVDSLDLSCGAVVITVADEHRASATVHMPFASSRCVEF